MGINDLDAESVTVARRMDASKDAKKRYKISFGEGLANETVNMLEEIQAELYANAVAERDSRISQVEKWSDFLPALYKGHMVMVPFCGDEDAEEWIKEHSAIEDPITGQSA